MKINASPIQALEMHTWNYSLRLIKLKQVVELTLKTLPSGRWRGPLPKKNKAKIIFF